MHARTPASSTPLPPPSRPSRAPLLLALGLLTLAACDEPEDNDAGMAQVDAGPEPDGGTCLAGPESFPEVVPGSCEARIVDDTATLSAGDDGAGGFIDSGQSLGVNPSFHVKL